MMTRKITTELAAGAGRIQGDPDAGHRAHAHRAQAELIEMLAKLVLASVEQDSGKTEPPRAQGVVCERRRRSPRD